MNPALVVTIEAAFAHAETLPLPARAELYRSIARICGDENEARETLDCADEMLRVHQRCYALKSRFSQKDTSFTQKS